MKKILLIAVLAAIGFPFAQMIYDMASNSQQHEIGISTAQLNPKKEVKYFSVK